MSAKFLLFPTPRTMQRAALSRRRGRAAGTQSHTSEGRTGQPLRLAGVRSSVRGRRRAASFLPLRGAVAFLQGRGVGPRGRGGLLHRSGLELLHGAGTSGQGSQGRRPATPHARMQRLGGPRAYADGTGERSGARSAVPPGREPTPAVCPNRRACRGRLTAFGPLAAPCPRDFGGVPLPCHAMAAWRRALPRRAHGSTSRERGRWRRALHGGAQWPTTRCSARRKRWG